ncbi:site-2 protease family protein [Bacillus thuringiensis]|uniref:Site-2 protease family protein n=1 Tax=Bacillus thuringiensis TaxID=1428 RepID=A0AAW9JTN3_BACTU|nr:site-2 protease family protein [Bacillus thuringiensis]MDZ5480655.1 site-2 protease family protein [Bacillus thuringiensis]
MFQKIKNSRIRRLLVAVFCSFGATVFVLFSKLKGLILLIKWGKIGGTIISMFASMWAYTLLYPWQFAIGLVLLIFIHELGHVGFAKYKGIPITAPTFVPFLGAFVITKRKGLSLEEKAFISYGGPLIGFIGGLIFWGIATYVRQEWMLAVLNLFLLINLVNSFPFKPLDGYWILKIVGYKNSIIQKTLFGLFILMGFGLSIYFKNWTIFIIYVLLLIETWASKEGDKNKVYSQHKLLVSKSIFSDKNLMIPRKKREVSLTYKSENNTDGIDIYYPGVGLIGTIQEKNKEINMFKLTSTVPHGEQLLLTIQGEVSKNDLNNDVPLKTQYGYAVSYISLILVQSVFLYYIHG